MGLMVCLIVVNVLGLQVECYFVLLFLMCGWLDFMFLFDFVDWFGIVIVYEILILVFDLQVFLWKLQFYEGLFDGINGLVMEWVIWVFECCMGWVEIGQVSEVLLVLILLQGDVLLLMGSVFVLVL